MRVLVTGGAGYIGSHTALTLLRSGHDVVVVDNLVNSSPLSLSRVSELAGKPAPLHEVDVRDKSALRDIFAADAIDAVIHFAGLKAVGESVEKPILYYDVNIGSTVALCEVMEEFGVRRLVFSSSATVYGNSDQIPYVETLPLAPINPYGRTKAFIEEILGDLANQGTGWQVSLLRYFNPVGADPSGQIGEDPAGIPNNLLPFVAQVASGRRDELVVFGNDYDTPDGTGIRDYIHVSDLAAGHLAALDNLPPANTAEAYNLGSGHGYSVLEVVSAFEEASGTPIPVRIGPRRPGDAPRSVADPTKANQQLNWQAKLGLREICADSWRWQTANPDGYRALQAG